MKKQMNRNNYFPNNSVSEKDSFLYIKESFIAGGLGFFLFFCLLLLAKTVVFTFNIRETLTISTNDFIISFWGFLIFSFIMFVSKNRSHFNKYNGAN